MRDEKSMWRLAGAVGLIAIVLLCAITLIVLNIELNRIRPRIEAALTSALGREVVIEGEVSVGLALAPEVVARGIRIGNPDWASRDYFAYTERAEIQFELLPLLRDGLFIVSNVEFEGADIRLEQRDDGSNNWTIARNLPSNSPLPQIHRLRVEDSVVVLALPDTVQRRLYLEDFEATRTGFLALEVEANGAYRDWPFEFEAVGGPPRDPTTPGSWPFEVELDIDGLRAELVGEFTEVFRLPGLAFDLRVIGGDVGWLEQIFDLAPLDDRYRLSSAVRLTDSGFTLLNIEGSLEDIESVENLVVTDGEVVFEGRDLELSAEGTLDGMPFELSMAASEVATLTELTDARLEVRLNNTDVNAAGMARWVDGALELDIGLTLATPRVDDFSELVNVALPQWGPFQASTRLVTSAGRFELTNITARLGASRLAGELLVSTTAQRPSVTGNVRSARVDLSDFMADADLGEWNRALLDAPFPTDWMTVLDVDLNVAIDEVSGAPVPLRNISFSASLEQGQLTVDPFAISLAAVALSGASTLSGGTEPSIEIQVRAQELEPEDVLRSLELPESVRGILRDLGLRLVASGRSLNSTIDRVSLELSASSGDFDFGTVPEDDLADLHLNSARLVIERDEPVELTLSGNVEALPFELLVSGGRLRDLLPGGEMWPALGLSITTRLVGQPLTISGELRPFVDLLNRRDVTLNLAGKLGGVQAEATGVISLTGDIASTPFNVHVTSEDPAELVDLLGLAPVFPVLPRRIEASGVMSYEDERIVVREARVRTENGEIIGGELVVSTTQPLRISVDLELTTLDLDSLTGYVDAAAESAETDAERLFSTRPLLFDWPEAMEMSSSLRIGELHFLGLTFRGVSSSTQLDQGMLNWQGRTDDGTVNASVTLDPRHETPQATINLQLRDYRPRSRVASLETVPASGSTGPAIGADVSLTGRGESIAALMGSADGEIKVWAGPGTLGVIRGVGLSRSVVRQILRTLNPVSGAEPQTELVCGALYLEVEDGIASTTRGVALQTPDLNFLGGGAINMKTEELDARFRFQPRRGLGLSVASMTAPFVNVGGTLLNPRVGLNTGSSIAVGSAVWATGGLSLLYTGFFQRIFAARRPCQRVLPELAENSTG